MSKRIAEEEVLTQVYGELTPLKEVAPYTWISKNGSNRSKRVFLCECSCGNSLEVSLEHLRSGYTQSCGCYQKWAASDYNTTHGKYRGAGNTHKYHNLWRAMITRCETDFNYQKLVHSVRFFKRTFLFLYLY